MLYWLVLLVAIVDYGAVAVTTVSILCAIIFTILPLALLLRGVPHHTRHTLVAAITLLGITGAWVLFQISPLPGGAFEHPAWSEALRQAPQTVAVLSVTPADDLAAFNALALPFGVFMAGLVLFDTDKRALSALRIMAIAGGIIALWSLLQFLLFPATLGFGEKRYYLTSLTGFFVNRNTAATFFGLIVLLLFASLWRSASALEPVRIRVAMAQNRPLPADQRKLLIGVFAVLALLGVALVTLMLTRSRAGTGASFAALLLLGIGLAAGIRGNGRQGFGTARRMRRPLRILATLAAVVVITIVFASLAGRALLRAEVQGTDDGRFCVMPRIVSAIGDYFPFGSGLASFRQVYAGYHDSACGISAVWYEAHNVYAEGLLTLGVAFPLLVAVITIWLATVFIRGIRNRRSLRFAGVLGLAALVLVAIHSALDFSLQIPGFSIAFAALLAPLVTISLRPAGGGGTVRRKRSAQAHDLSGN